MSSETAHPTLDELLTGAVRTIEDVLLPELQTSWAKATAVQLQGLLRYAAARQTDDLPARQHGELQACLAALSAMFPADVAAIPAGADDSLLRSIAGGLLAEAEGVKSPLADAVRANLRPLLARHTAEELAASGPLLQGFMTGFRGVASDAE